MNFQKVGVVGSGIMGGGIAEVAATAGATVILRSRTLETADALLEGLDKSLAKKVVKHEPAKKITGRRTKVASKTARGTTTKRAPRR